MKLNFKNKDEYKEHLNKCYREILYRKNKKNAIITLEILYSKKDEENNEDLFDSIIVEVPQESNERIINSILDISPFNSRVIRWYRTGDKFYGDIIWASNSFEDIQNLGKFTERELDKIKDDIIQKFGFKSEELTYFDSNRSLLKWIKETKR